MTLSEFLEEKPLYYAKIDYKRMPRVYKKIKEHFCCSKIIHLVGTNGKGTTGRFLASALYKLGYKVGHYTSPHIINFNERIWLNGQIVSGSLLESSHQKLQKLLTKKDAESLSFFEYTTFLAMLVFNNCEYIILEAGLGGEHDATAVFPKNLTLVTPISYDHEAFLGSTIESIATEKLNAIQNNAILALQEYTEVYEVAKNLARKKNLNISKISEYIKTSDEAKIQKISKRLSLVLYLSENLKLSIACLNFLNIDYDVEHFDNARLFGRLTSLNENIIIDVGHNPLAAHSIKKALEPQKYILVYNTYEDKDYFTILDILKPIIEHLEIIDIDDKRIEKEDKLQKVLTDLKIKYKPFKKHQESKKYLVFGSFKVVEKFLKVYDE
ncbi:MAG: Mur ligase family protein [Sulfurimonas sp.]|nr:Mur ligase family protein [Sulfurimonas sp.]